MTGLSQAPTRAAEASVPQGAVTAETEALELVEADDNRIGLYVTNNGAKAVWLCLCSPLVEEAVAGEGPMLVKEGGSVYISDYSGVVQVITAEGESVVSFSAV